MTTAKLQQLVDYEGELTRQAETNRDLPFSGAAKASYIVEMFRGEIDWLAIGEEIWTLLMSDQYDLLDWQHGNMYRLAEKAGRGACNESECRQLLETFLGHVFFAKRLRRARAS